VTVTEEKVGLVRDTSTATKSPRESSYPATFTRVQLATEQTDECPI